MRCVHAPYRIVDDGYLVARPEDGRVLVLTPLVGWVWTHLDGGDWESLLLIAEDLYPEIVPGERAAVLAQSVLLLRKEGLIE